MPGRHGGTRVPRWTRQRAKSGRRTPGERRVRTLKRARIIFNNGFAVFDCTLRNISPSGALIDIPSMLGIPIALRNRHRCRRPRRPVHRALAHRSPDGRPLRRRRRPRRPRLPRRRNLLMMAGVVQPPSSRTIHHAKPLTGLWPPGSPLSRRRRRGRRGAPVRPLPHAAGRWRQRSRRFSARPARRIR